MGAETPRMHDALGNALVIKVKAFLAEMKVLERRRPAAPDSQRVLVVSDRGSLLGRQDRDVASRHLMRLAAFTANNCLTPKGCDLAFAVNLAATRRALRHYASRKKTRPVFTGPRPRRTQGSEERCLSLAISGPVLCRICWDNERARHGELGGGLAKGR